MHFTVLCCIPPYFFWFRHMSLAGKMFSCPRIQLFLIIVVVGIKYIGTDCVNPPVAAFAISTVNPMAVCLDVFRGFVLNFENLANFGIKAWTAAAFIRILDALFWGFMYCGRWWWWQIWNSDYWLCLWLVKCHLLFQKYLGTQEICKSTFSHFSTLVPRQ